MNSKADGNDIVGPERTGTWTREEMEYVDALVVEFRAGSLDDVKEGLTMRAFLAEKVHCNVKRISKKMEGGPETDHYKGRKRYVKRVFSTDEVNARKQRLQELRADFLRSLEILSLPGSKKYQEQMSTKGGTRAVNFLSKQAAQITDEDVNQPKPAPGPKPPPSKDVASARGRDVSLSAAASTPAAAAGSVGYTERDLGQLLVAAIGPLVDQAPQRVAPGAGAALPAGLFLSHPSQGTDARTFNRTTSNYLQGSPVGPAPVANLAAALCANGSWDTEMVANILHSVQRAQGSPLGPSAIHSGGLNSSVGVDQASLIVAILQSKLETARAGASNTFSNAQASGSTTNWNRLVSSLATSLSIRNQQGRNLQANMAPLPLSNNVLQTLFDSNNLGADLVARLTNAPGTCNEESLNLKRAVAALMLQQGGSSPANKRFRHF